MKTPGIYKIYSLSKSDRFYVGSAVKLQKRMQTHFSDLKLNKHRNSKLQRHYNKYGVDDLVFAVIEPCMPEFLIIREQYYIDTLNPYFNISPIAGSQLGLRHSKDSKNRMSEAHKGKKLSEEHKQKMSEARKGEKHWLFGKNHSEESKIKMANANKGNKYCLGFKHSEEAKSNMSKAHKGQKVSEETRQKISKLHKGRKRSVETCLRISEVKKKYWAEKRLAQLN